jgi:hypothetical protein
MKRAIFVPLLLVMMLCFANEGWCRAVPIDEPSTAIHAKVTQAQVRDAIIRAGTNIGWQMWEDSPGLVMGTTQQRSHTVNVAIPYDTNRFTIKYHSSVNMMEGKAGPRTIHRNYNRWVERLNNNITAEIAKAGLR